MVSNQQRKSCHSDHSLHKRLQAFSELPEPPQEHEEVLAGTSVAHGRAEQWRRRGNEESIEASKGPRGNTVADVTRRYRDEIVPRMRGAKIDPKPTSILGRFSSRKN
jgi:hypothetical protein